MPDETTEEEYPPDRAVLAAITAFQNEVAQIMSEICATINSHIKSVYADLREEIATVKKDLQMSISTLETLTSHSNTTREIERLATFHSDSVSTLQRQVTCLNAEGKTCSKM